MVEADFRGKPVYAKLVNIAKSEAKGYDECLQFNSEVLEDLDEMIFKDHFLGILTQISNEEVTGFVTDPYDCRLDQFIVKEALSEKDCLGIF